MGCNRCLWYTYWLDSTDCKCVNKNYNGKPRIKNFEQWWLIDFLNNYKGNIKIGVDYDFKTFELIQHMTVEKTDKGYKSEVKLGLKK